MNMVELLDRTMTHSSAADRRKSATFDVDRRQLPPTSPAPTELLLSRQPHSKTFVMYTDNGSSYRMRYEELTIFLRIIGFSDFRAEQVGDQLANFYGLHVDVPNQQVTHVPRQRVDELVRGWGSSEVKANVKKTA